MTTTLPHALARAGIVSLRRWLVATLLAISTATQAASNSDALPAVAQSPVQGGLCVLVGPADAALARDIAKRGSFLVHTLADGDVETARAGWHSDALGGRVTAEPQRVDEAEVQRVLRPGGEGRPEASKAQALTARPVPG